MLDNELKREFNGERQVNYHKDVVSVELDEQAEIDRINESREIYYDEGLELEQFRDDQSPVDLEEGLEEGVDNIEDTMEWLEIGSSAIGGGVPVMDVGLEDAIDKVLENEFDVEGMLEDSLEKLKEEEIDKVLENEFDVEGMLEDSLEKLKEKETDRGRLMDSSINNSGPEMNFNKRGR